MKATTTPLEELDRIRTMQELPYETTISMNPRELAISLASESDIYGHTFNKHSHKQSDK